jgi:hypothetical protein
MASMPGIVIKIGVDATKALSNLNKVERSLKKTITPAQKMTGVLRKMGPALGAAAAGIGAVAVAVGVDAVRAFQEEEKSLAQFHQTLKNLDLEGQTKTLDKWVDNLQYAANVADSDLRPAMSRLLRSTGDVAEAQKALGIALDISAATGKDLDTVANGLGKAYDGNAASLGRLGLGLDKTILASGDMALITDTLIDKFGGQSAAQAGTLSGSIEGVKIAVDELSESFGTGLVGAADDSATALAETEANLRKMQPEVERLGAGVNEVATAAIDAADGWSEWVRAIEEGRIGDAWDIAQATPGAEMDATIERIRLAAAALDMQAAAAGGAATALNRYSHAQRTASAAAAVGYTGGGADWAAIDERLKGARTRYEWGQMEKANARRAAKRAAAKAARLAKIADRKHAARTGTKATATTPGKRSC